MAQTQHKNEIIIPLSGIELPGYLTIPENAKGIIVFSHGSGSSHQSPRNNYVAEVLQKHGFATLLMDLLTNDEDENFDNRFDIELLTERLLKINAWVQQNRQTADLPIGYFGASTGAASALRAAALLGSEIKAVVSRGGRPDLAGRELPKVQAATLLLVGENDSRVISLNKMAYQDLTGTRELILIANATHLFPEPGKLQEVAQLAADWFNKYIN